MPIPYRPLHRTSATHIRPDAVTTLYVLRCSQKFLGRRESNKPHQQRPYFSLLGGTNPFNRRYRASVAYCSLSCDTVPHISPTRDRFVCPKSNISPRLASVSEANALSHSANEAFSASTIAALSAVSGGTFAASAGVV